MTCLTVSQVLLQNVLHNIPVSFDILFATVLIYCFQLISFFFAKELCSTCEIVCSLKLKLKIGFRYGTIEVLTD